MIKPLTSLRFFAAAAVVIFHLGVPVLGADNTFSVLGELGIKFFFVLSGFIISTQYAHRVGTAADIGKFYIARAGRIFPLHLVTMLIAVPLVLHEGISYSVGRTFSTAILVNSWIPGQWFTYNFVAWSLSVELFFYLLSPLILRLLSGRGALFYFSFSVSCGLIFWLLKGALNVLAPGNVKNVWWWFLFVSPYFYLFSYLTGVGAGLGYRRIRGRVNVTPSIWTMLEVGVLVLCAASLYAILQMEYKREGIVISFAAVILVFAFSGGGVSRLLSFKPMVLLGEISFAIYMLHQLLLRFVNENIKWIIYPAGKWYEQLIYVIATLSLSWICYRFIEEPCRLCVKAWIQRGKHQPSTPAYP